MNLYEAIFFRRSVKDYTNEVIESDTLMNILKYDNSIIQLYPEIDYRLSIKSADEFKAHRTGFNNIKAPYYLLVFSKKEGEYVTNAACILEQMSLYMYTLGIGSCFLGFARYDENDGEYNNCAVLAFGRAKTAIKRNPEYADRIQSEKLCVFKEEVSSYVTSILDAAVLAPSAFNIQPWRFVAYNDRIHVFERKTKINPGIFNSELRKLDIGAMYAHIAITAEELWVDINVKRLPKIENKVLKNNSYVFTIFLNP